MTRLQLISETITGKLTKLNAALVAAPTLLSEELDIGGFGTQVFHEIVHVSLSGLQMITFEVSELARQLRLESPVIGADKREV